MVRIITINKFVNNRNRLLFRWPVQNEIYDCRCKEFSSSALNAGNEYRKRVLLDHVHLVNNVSHRFNSSSGDVTSLNIVDVSFKKKRKSKKTTLQTCVTEVSNDSSSVKQESVGMIPKKKLKKFILESAANATLLNSTKSNSNDHDQSVPMTTSEKPFLFTPNDFKFDPVRHKVLIENLQNSFQKFVVKRPTALPFIDEQSVVDSKTTTITESKNEKLQKQFQPENFRFQASLEDSVQAYINACVTLDMTDRAFSVLNDIRRKTLNGKKFQFNSPDLFVELMAKYAMGKNLKKVNQIYSIMLEENVSITPQIYMLMLSCLGRSPGNNKLIENCIKMAAQKNISMNDIMDKSIFSGDQRLFVLEAIRRIKPDFVPVYTPPKLEYDNELVNFMNTCLRDIEQKPESLIEDAENCDISKSKAIFSLEQLEKFSKQQFASEYGGQTNVKNIQMLDPEICSHPRVKNSRQLLDKLFVEWKEQTKITLTLRLNMLQHRMRTVSTKNMSVYPYLKLLPPEELTDILLDQVMGMAQGSEVYSETVAQIYLNIGRKILHRHRMNVKKQSGVNDKIIELYKTYTKILCSGQCSENPRQLWQRILHQSRGDGPCVSQKNIKWPWQVQITVGRTLFRMLAENIFINTNILKPNQPTQNARAIYSVFVNRDLKSREEIRLHPIIIELCREAKLDTIKFNSNEIPMLCPPMPYTSFGNNGGYLISHSELVRLSYECRKQIDMIQRAPTKQLYPTLDALNQLGSVPWQINTRILDLAIEVFNLGGNKKLNVPLTPDNLLTDKQLKYLGLTSAELAQRKKGSGYDYVQQQKNLFSLYRDTLYKLSLAHHFRDKPFWLPHNMDFRGRTYPIPPHLTHLSGDLTRSMLMFHQKQPLGQFGLDWLKLHCINLTGLKKRNSIQDRLIFAESVMDDIIDSADSPLDGRQWWLNSDDPWQTLAACMEITNAIRSPDPTKYMSSFPIHQDGSCNGLQHYAALGRDVDGAASVNLAPADAPQDVYTTISNRVEEQRKRDAEMGHEVALALEGLIKRKMIKQTVMTTVYGVTKYGAKLQIEKQLKNIDFNSKLINKAALYLVKATFGSLSETFESARQIQDWFVVCAAVISKYNNQHVEWVSPLGFPIIQPYTKEPEIISNASLTKLYAEGALNTMKEKNAFPPNFIHSLDSCHMMLTALNCERAGITFVSVHDCFWTHANTAQIMSRICREQFVLLHSQPILENLGESFYRKYTKETFQKKEKGKKISETERIQHENLFRTVPKKGKFDLKKVLESVYFFS